jgi:hypothetical protein
MPTPRPIPAPRGQASAPRYMGRFSRFIKPHPGKKPAFPSKKAKNGKKPLKKRPKQL